jgi:ribosomal protein S18 acetylase RimI-like enzyme
MTTIQIRRGFEESERERVGSLYWEAFRRKLRPAFLNDATGLETIQAAVRPDRMLVARIAGEVAGVCGYNEQGAGAADISWGALRTRLSLIASIRAVLVLGVLSSRKRGDALVLDGICVHSDKRGRGVGTVLLDAAVEHAGSLGLKAVQLSVVDTNPRAEALYRRRGFQTVGTGSLDLLAPLYGFDRHTTMERRLDQ